MQGGVIQNAKYVALLRGSHFQVQYFVLLDIRDNISNNNK